jgi:DNA-binding NarL/FixJ family response regulator
VVEDSELFRKFICSTLGKRPELQIVSEVSDGLEAVQKAEELQPDLILLDIGLPNLNGIEAARRIRKLSPSSKILFLSQESSTDLVCEALAAGACGYVLKTDAGSELLTAVNVVLRGKQFVGGRFVDHDFTGASEAGASEDLRNKRVFAPLQLQHLKIARRHEAGFYSDDRCLLDDLTQFIGATLKAGNAAIVVATESHRNSLLPKLQASGLDVSAAIEEGRYISLDAADILSTFMVNGMPDPVRFLKLLGNLIARAAEATNGERGSVAVFGECVHLLWAQGNTEAAIQVERLGNQLARTYDVCILCGYSLGGVQGGMDSHVFQRICAEHSAVYSR